MPHARVQDTLVPPDLFGWHGGDTAAAMLAVDWAATPLGPREAWPPSLATLSDIVLGSRQPMFITWGPARTLLYNDGFAALLGRRHPGALGRPMRQAWPEIWSDLAPLLARTDAGEPVHMDHVELVPQRDGEPEETHFAFSCTPVRDQAGLVAGVFCVCTETTATVRAQRLLRAESERMRQMFDQAPGFICLLRGPSHVFEMVNQAYTRLIGFRDVVGKAVVEAVPEVVGQGFIELLDQVFATGVAVNQRRTRLDLRRSPGGDSETRYVDFVYQPMVDASGAVSGIFVEGSDVTDAKLADDTLRDNTAWTRGLADAIPGFLWAADATGRLTQTSASWLDYSGSAVDATLGQGWAEFIHPLDAARVAGIWSHSVASGAFYNVEFRVRRNDGTYRWNLVRASPLRDECERITGWVGLNVDIDDQKRAEAALQALNETLEQRVELAVAERETAEDALRQAQKMEAIGQLTGGIAHDFNNMLQGVMGSLEVLRRRLANGQVGEAGAMIDLAMQSATRAATMTRRLLGFARRQMLHDRPVEPNTLVSAIAELVRGTVGPSVTLRLELGGGSWPVLCDANQLESALLNLAINARDAMPRGGVLTLSTAEVWLDAATLAGHADAVAGDYAEIAVTDTGTGMEPEVASRAFEPFFTTKPMGHGTGLGLSQLYGFVRQSRGTVRLDTEPGRGTTVRLYLPRHLGGPVASEPEPAQVPVGECARATILLVEDEAMIRAMTAEALAELGYVVFEAADGAEALSMLTTAGVVDALVTDVGLPGGINGRQLADAARERRPDLPVLFITGYAGTALEHGQLAPGMSMIGKPFTLGALTGRVATMLAGTQTRIGINT